MDITEIQALSKKELDRRRQALQEQPPEKIAIPIEFPFLIGRAKSQIQQNAKRQRILRQSPVFLGEGLLPTPVNIWNMRNEFLSLEKTDSALQAFVDRYGWWDATRRSVPITEIWNFRELFKLALLCPEKTRGKLLSRTTTLQASFEYRDGSSAFVASTTGCEEALILSVLCDVARKKQFRECETEGCREIFEITSQHERKHHNAACKHKHLMRRRREKQREKRAKIRAVTKGGK